MDTAAAAEAMPMAEGQPVGEAAPAPEAPALAMEAPAEEAPAAAKQPAPEMPPAEMAAPAEPLTTATPAAMATQAPEIQAEPPAAAEKVVAEEENLILGIAPTEEQGRIMATDTQATAPLPTQPPAPMTRLTGRRLLQTGLGTFAILTGLLSFVLARKRRS
jgi:hypothetical protein